ncbi:MAG: hypothetical protein ACXWQR_02820 [Ktedonobacterales bacterium]
MLAQLTRLLRRVALRFALPCLLVLTTYGAVLVAPVAEAHRHAEGLHLVRIVANDNGKDNKDFRGSYSMPTQVPTGLVEIKFFNVGHQGHMAQFFLLKKGVSEALFLQRLAAVANTMDPAKEVVALKALLAIASAAGGADSITQGNEQDVIERLRPGHYVAVCFDTTSDGVAHFERGMAKSFFASDNAKAPVTDDVAPSDGTVLEFDHQINVPHVITQHRPLLLKVVVRDQTHELGLLRVPDGTTKEDLLKCFTGPPSACPLKSPPVDAGGAAAIAPGSTHWVELFLAPGTYAAVCFVPDIMTGMPHAAMGMITVFKVNK